MLTSRISREPGTALENVMLVPLSAEALEAALQGLPEAEELFEVPERWAILTGAGEWSALVAWSGALTDAAPDLAAALAEEQALEVYELCLEQYDDPTAGRAYLDEHRDGLVKRLWGRGAAAAHQDPLSFARARLGKSLPAYRAGALVDEPRPEPRIIPWAALGVVAGGAGGASAPASFAVRLAGGDTLDAIAGGLLIASQETELSGDRGATGGLFDEQIFGPLRRDARGVPRLERWADEEPRDRPQATRFGRLALPHAVVHPWAVRTSSGAVARTLFALASCQEVVVDGELVPIDDAPADRRWLLGGEAIDALVRRGALPEVTRHAVLRGLPVLPAGLRPIIEEEDGYTLRHDATLLYAMVQRETAKLSRLLQHDAAQTLLADQLRRLQRAVEALLLDGARAAAEQEAGGDWEPCPPEEEPLVRSLRHLLAARLEWAREVETLLRGVPSRPFSKRWHGLAYQARAWLEASALEVVPARDDGRCDEEVYATSLLDRRLRAFRDVYIERLGEVLQLSDETPGDGVAPPIDIYVSPPQPDGTRWILTAGMSAREMLDDPLKHADAYAPMVTELAMRVPAMLEPAMLEHCAHGLRALARYPFVNRTFLANLHSVSVGRPIAPGSALTAFVFVTAEESLLWSLQGGLPRTPEFLIALGITEGELARLNGEVEATAWEEDDDEGGDDDDDARARGRVLAELLEHTRLCTDPFRRVR